MQATANTITGTQIAALLFSSSVFAALLSTLGNHLLAQLQFKRDYYKEIIAKRLHAYEQVDELIGMLRITSYDAAGRIAHGVFINKEIHDRANVLAGTGGGLGLYLSKELYQAMSELNLLLLKRPDNASEKQAFEIGAAHREQISSLRTRMEHIETTDLQNLYKVRKFLKQIKKDTANPSNPFLVHLPKHGAFSFSRDQDPQN
jgi:hypothetical protein